MVNKKNISVCFTPDQFEKYADGTSTVVVVDLLRATSVISTAFECGVPTIIPVRTLDEARKYKDLDCLLYTSPSPRDRTRSRMPSSA